MGSCVFIINEVLKGNENKIRKNYKQKVINKIRNLYTSNTY